MAFFTDEDEWRNFGKSVQANIKKSLPVVYQRQQDIKLRDEGTRLVGTAQKRSGDRIIFDQLQQVTNDDKLFKSALQGYRKVSSGDEGSFFGTTDLNDDEVKLLISKLKTGGATAAFQKMEQQYRAPEFQAAREGPIRMDAATGDIRENTAVEGFVDATVRPFKEASSAIKVRSEASGAQSKKMREASLQQFLEEDTAALAKDPSNEQLQKNVEGYTAELQKQQDSITDDDLEKLEALADRDGVKDLANIVESALSVSPIGVGKKLLTTIGKQGVKNVAKRMGIGAAEGAAIGGAIGGLDVVGIEGKDAELKDVAIGAAFGAGAGTVLGGALPALGATGRMINKGATGVDKTAGRAVDTSIQKLQQLGKRQSQESQSVASDLINAAKKEKGKYKDGLVKTVLQKTKETLNVSHELAKIDNAFMRKAGLKRSKLNQMGESLETTYDNTVDFKRKSQLLYDHRSAVGKVMQKHAGDEAEFNNYRNALAEINSRGKGTKYRSALEDKDLKEMVADYEKANPGARKDIHTINEALNTARAHAKKSGALSDELDAKLGNSKIYSPVAVVDSGAPKAKMGGKATTRGEQRFAKQSTGASDATLVTDFSPIINYIDKAYEDAAGAKLSQLLLKRQKEGLVKGAEIISESGAKANKKLLRDYSQETTKAAKKVQGKIKLGNKQVRSLNKAINDLNKEGVKTSLGRKRPDAPKQATKTITVKTVKPLMVDNAPKALDDLGNSYSTKQMLKEEYGSGAKAIEQMAADIHNGGYTQLMALNPRISKATARSIANQILKEPTFKPGKITVKEGKIGRDSNPVTLIKQMVETDPGNLARIKQKLAKTEPKLAQKLDEISAAQDDLASLKSEAKGYKQAASEIVDDPTTGLPFIRGIDEDGLAFAMQVPPNVARLLKGTDIQPSSAFMKGMLNVQRTFQTFWSGFANPIFSLVSTPLYDASANINSLIDNPKAFFNSLTPDSVVTAVRGLKNSDDFQIALRSQGAAPQGGSMLPQEVSKTAQSIMSKRNFASRTGYLAKHPKELMHSLDQFSGKVGNATRTRLARGYYKNALKEGSSEVEALREAAYAFNNMAPNFNRVSALTRDANAFIPYITASVAGNRSMWQPILNNPGRAAAVYGGIAATFVGATAHNLASEKGQEFYKQMRESGKQYVLDSNYIVVLPTASFNEETGEWSGIIKMPVAPEYRGFNRLTHNIVQQATTGESDLSPTLVAGAILNTMTGGIPESATQGPGIISTVQALSGANPRGSVFDTEPLVPGWMADLPKEEQVYPWTSNPAKFFSDITGNKISPIQADAIIGQFGSAGGVLQGRGLPEQAKSKFKGAYTDSLKKQVYNDSNDYKGLSKKMKKAGGGVSKARSIAETHNKKVDGLINRVQKSSLSEETKAEVLKGLQARKASTEDYALKKRLE